MNRDEPTPEVAFEDEDSQDFSASHMRHSYGYILNFIKHNDPESFLPSFVCDAIVEGDINFPKLKKALVKRHKDRTAQENIEKKDQEDYDYEPEDWSFIRDQLEKESQKLSSSANDPAYENLDSLCDYLQIEPSYKKVMTLLLCTENCRFFKNFLKHAGNHHQQGLNRAISQMLDIPVKKIALMLRDDSPVIMNRLVHPYEEDEDGISLPELDHGIMESLSYAAQNIETICANITGSPRTTHLTLGEDFAHLKKDNEEILRILSDVQKKRAEGKATQGINIFLFGKPGVGKTEYVKALCKQSGMTLYATGEEDGHDKSPDNAKRLSAALRSQSILKHQPGAAVMVDEMNDLLSETGMNYDESSGAPSKVFINRVLENNSTVTFWIVNDPAQVDPAYRSRMSYTVEMKIPPASVRTRMWEQIALAQKFNLSAADAGTLGRQYRAPARDIAKAIKNVGSAPDPIQAIERSLRSSALAVFGTPDATKIKDYLIENYDLSLLNLTVEDQEYDITGLTEKLVASQYRNFSVLLYGPTGTGKTAYVSHLAEKLDMEVLKIKASDILSKWVGDNEQNIAKAFATAREQGLLLFFDEGDSIVRDRNKAERGWEASMVNEFLTQLDEHRLPVVMASNLMNDIDVAVKRRFTFKLKCDYMKPEQAQAAFRHFFDREPPRELAAVSQLTPGDFANVKKMLRFERTVSDAQLVAMLAHEVRIKNEKQSREIGFIPKTSPILAPLEFRS